MERVLSIPAIRECNSISCYLSMESGEVKTSAIVDAILQAGEYYIWLKDLLKLCGGKKKGKTLYVPKIRSKNGGMDFLRCYSADDLASFPAGTWGIREPGDLWEGKNRSSSEFWRTITPPSPLLPKKRENFLSEVFFQIVLSCVDESLDVILLPGILFYFVLTFNLVFYWVVDVTFFFCFSFLIFFFRRCVWPQSFSTRTWERLLWPLHLFIHSQWKE